MVMRFFSASSNVYNSIVEYDSKKSIFLLPESSGSKN